MPIDILACPPIEPFELRQPPVSGVAWADGQLVGLEGGQICWRRSLSIAPILSAAGRRLYLAVGPLLACLDRGSGALVWEERLEAPVVDLAASRMGVEVLLGRILRSVGPTGETRADVALPVPCTRVVCVGVQRYVGGSEGIWRISDASPGELAPPIDACTRFPCQAWYPQPQGLLALVEAPGGSLLLEDAPLPLLWPFLEARHHLIEPYGIEQWAVAPVEGPAGVWVVDRRLRSRWRFSVEGRLRALAVAGAMIAALVDDRDTSLLLIHPDVSEPLRLPAPNARRLYADAGVLYVASPSRTSPYLLRERP